MPEQFLKMYDPEKVELPEKFMPEHPFDNGWMTGRDEVLAGHPRTEQEVRRHIAEYYAMISHLDDAIGRVIAKLAEKGVLEDTIIVFAGGTGPGLHDDIFGRRILPDGTRIPDDALQLVVDRGAWLLGRLATDPASESPCGWWCEDPEGAGILAAGLLAAGSAPAPGPGKAVDDGLQFLIRHDDPKSG